MTRLFRRALHRWRMWRSPSYALAHVAAAAISAAFSQWPKPAEAAIVCRTEDELPPREYLFVCQVFYVSSDRAYRVWDGAGWRP